MIRCRRQRQRAVANGRARLLMTILVSAATIAAVLVIGLLPRRAVSLPLYARQTGQPCATCHTAFWELTPFGRRFKLGGYTLGGGDWSGPPFAVTFQPGYTYTEVGQPGGAAPHFGPNKNVTVQATSLFTGGRITDDLGAFIQGTYDNVFRRFGWDQADIRNADTVNVTDHNLLWFSVGGVQGRVFIPSRAREQILWFVGSQGFLRGLHGRMCKTGFACRALAGKR